MRPLNQRAATGAPPRITGAQTKQGAGGKGRARLQVAETSMHCTPRGRRAAISATSASWPKESNKSASSSTGRGRRRRERKKRTEEKWRTKQLEALCERARPEQPLPQRRSHARGGGDQEVVLRAAGRRKRGSRRARRRQLAGAVAAPGGVAQRGGLGAYLRAELSRRHQKQGARAGGGFGRPREQQVQRGQQVGGGLAGAGGGLRDDVLEQVTVSEEGRGRRWSGARLAGECQRDGAGLYGRGEREALGGGTRHARVQAERGKGE